MQKSFWNDVAEYVKNNRYRSVWRKIVQVLCCIVVFCTTYALILPAITMEQKSFCGLEEHVHTKECYELVEVPSELICPLVEIKKIEDDSMAAGGKALQEGEALASNSEVITVADATMLNEELSQEEGTVASEAEVPEGQQASVSDGDAGASVAETVNTATESTETEVSAEETVILHTHTEDCYGVPAELPLTCILEEGEEHTHDFLCYGTWKLVCTKEEHTHSLICFSDPEADVETEAVWENIVSHLNLTGVWEEDVVTIAKSQLGYKESTLNYDVDENDNMLGYTRYGAWAGKPYMSWNSTFADFCIFYAGIVDMPVREDCGEWVDALINRQLYHEAAEYVPMVGNFLFLDSDGDGRADSVSIVSEVKEATEEEVAKVCAVTGDLDGQVQYITYDLTETSILGYGMLPKQPAPYFAYTDNRVQVEVVLPEDSHVPRNAQLVVTPIGQENGSYTGLVEQAQEVVEGKIAQIQFYDISFYTKNQEYIPVNDKAKVTLRMAENMDAENTVVLHYDESQEAPVIVKDDSTEQDMVISAGTFALQEEPAENMNTVVSFETEGFSIFAVVDVGIGNYYEVQVLKTLTGLWYDLGSDRTFMIFNNSDIINNDQDNNVDTRVALKAERVTIHEKDGDGATDYEECFRLKGEEVTKTNYTTVGDKDVYTGIITSVEDQNLLWVFEQQTSYTENGATITPFTIRSLGTGQYLSINTDGVLELSDNPYNFTSNGVYPNGIASIRLNSLNGDGYVAFYNQTERPNQENIHVFATTSDINDTIHNGLALAEYIGHSNLVNRVKNLDGKIVAIVAVNNAVDGYDTCPAVASQYNDQGDELTGSDTNGWNITDGVFSINNENDVNNRIAWEFEDADVPGTYYIKVANVFDTPSDYARLYLNISKTGLTMTTTKQAIEVVEASINDDDPVKYNVVCLRAKVDDVYYTIQLNNNYGSRDFYSSGKIGSNGNEVNNPANHFVLVDLADTEPAQFRDWIDQIPSTEDFDAATKLEGSTFAEQVEYRKRMRELAMDAKAYYDENWASLSTVQKNFIGEKRIDKLLNDLEWLWREDPKRVTPAAPDAKVKLFNYDISVNNNALATNKYFQFFSWDPSEKSEDGQQNDNNVLKRIKMSPVLGENGYPEIIGGYQQSRDTEGNVIKGEYDYVSIDNGELDYLFQTPVAEMENGGGLFQLDNKGSYYYYSDMNAAWFNGNQFELYDTVVRPESTRAEYGVPNSTTNDSRSNFFPFNEVVGNVIYDYPGGLDETTVTTQYDGHTQTVEPTQTAYLNDKIDLWFGMSIEYDFFIPKDRTVDGQEMIFKFHGDDDVFVYVDDVLVLDIGGTHEARSGSINFTTGEVIYENVGNELVEGEEAVVDGDGNLVVSTKETTLAELYQNAGKTNIAMDDTLPTLADYTMHNLKFFYMERGGTYSYAGIEFNMPAVPEDTLEVSKEITTDEGVSVIDARLDYTFRVRSVLNDVVQDDFFVKEGAVYQIYENDTYIGDGKVGANGCFKLKAGQKAKFYNIAATQTNKFVVEEIMPTVIAEQYDLQFKNLNNVIIPPNATYQEGNNTVYQTPVYALGANAEEQNISWSVICDNVVDEEQLDTLKITKREGEGTEIDENKEFQIKVLVGNNAGDLIPLPMGTEYTTISKEGGEESNPIQVSENGIITLKAGETATIRGFLAGTYWQVMEDLSGLQAGEHYTPFYSMQVNNGNEIIGNSGTFAVKDTIEFFVTNFGCDFLVEFPLSKQTIGNTGNSSFTFEVEGGTWNSESKVWTKERTWNPVSIMVQDGNLVKEIVRVGGYNHDGDNNTYYYKVYERRDAGNFVYDETFYILEVQTKDDNSDSDDDHSKVGEIARIWKNGKEEININDSDPISFTNYKATTLTVEKQVINSSDPNYTEDRAFTFEATVKLDDNVFTGINEPEEGSSEYGKYSVDENGIIHFNLKHGESVILPVPVNATVTINETPVSGYDTNYQVTRNGAEEALKSGTNTESIPMNEDAVKVTYTNKTGYELPATGGSGTHLYLIGGLLLSLAAGGLLLMKSRSRT